MTEPLGNYGIPTEPEWLIRANAGIITKTEIPRIIPPLPEGDTKDLKVWKEYWKQHDAFIAAQARDKTLTDVLKALDNVVLIDENNQYYFWLEDVELAIKSLRIPKEQQR